MTTTPQTCMCECEECLALRAAEDDPGSGENVAAFEHDGSTYEIDHLGTGPGSQWADFAVYCDGEEVAEFTLPEPAPRPGPRPAGLPVSADELVRQARQALSGWTGRDDPPLAAGHAAGTSPGSRDPARRADHLKTRYSGAERAVVTPLPQLSPSRGASAPDGENPRE